MPGYLLALDQGTTTSRAIVFDAAGEVRGFAQHEFPQSFPQPGWVEHDPDEIWEARSCAPCAASSSVTAPGPRTIAAIGITNQRETAVVWDRATGEPIYPAVVWQSRQTADLRRPPRPRVSLDEVRRRTGLVIDAYFSASKIRFILDAVPGAQQRAERGELAFGTIDSWLLHRLTGGRVHVTDETNASRTMLYDIHRPTGPTNSSRMLDIPRALLPEVRPPVATSASRPALARARRSPIAGVAGDQQAALFGQRCTRRAREEHLRHRLLPARHTPGETARVSTPASSPPLRASRAPARVRARGLVFVTGAAIQWLRDGLGLIEQPRRPTASPVGAGHRRRLPRAGVHRAGRALLGPGARGALVGLTRGTSARTSSAPRSSRSPSRRATSSPVSPRTPAAARVLRVDGGACRNDFLMQFQADILGIPVHGPRSSRSPRWGRRAWPVSHRASGRTSRSSRRSRHRWARRSSSRA
jgi:glycerol kinase